MTEQVPTFDLDGPGRTLVVTGDVDDPVVGDLEAAIDQLLAVGGQQTVRLDLNGVTFLPSGAVGVLARGVDAAARSGVELVLVARRGGVAARVLEVTAMPHSHD